jgi:hypothetical protein
MSIIVTEMVNSLFELAIFKGYVFVSSSNVILYHHLGALKYTNSREEFSILNFFL